MALVRTVTYDDAPQFTVSDATLIEVTTDAHLIQNPESATFLATLLLAGGDAEISADSTVATINGNVVVTGGAAEIRDVGSYIEWITTLSDPGDDGAVRLVFTPQFTGAAPNQMTLFALQNPTGGVNASVVRVRLTGALIIAEIYAQNQVNIVSIQVGSQSWTAGQSYEVELNWDIVTGATRLYLDGTQIGATHAGTGTRLARDEMRSGSQIGVPGDTPNFDLEELALYPTPQHVGTSYTALGVQLYSVAAPSVYATAEITTDELCVLAETATTPAGSSVRWIVRVGGLRKWWDGDSWENSDGSAAQSNLASELTAVVLKALDLTPSAMATFEALLVSNGDVTPTLTQHVTTYSFSADAGDLTRCIVYGFVKDSEENVLAGVAVKAENVAFEHGDHFIQASKVEVVTDAQGLFELDLIESATPDVYPYRITVGTQIFTRLQVPALATRQLSQLLRGN